MNTFCLAPLACLVCLAPLWAQTAEMQSKTQTVLFLQRLQSPDGGFKPTAEPKAKASLRATSSALRALHYLGGKLPNKDGCERFIASCFDKATGGFADTPGGTTDVLSTAVGLMAVVELGMPKDPYHSAAAKYLGDNAKTFDDVRIAAAALESIKAAAPKEMEWRDVAAKQEVPAAIDGGRARMLASKIVTLLRLGERTEAKAEIVKELQRGQNANGGYGKDKSANSDLETTYRVMRALWMLSAKPASMENMLNFLARCRNTDGGYAVVPGDTSSAAGTYYAAIISHWLDGKK
jgi:prenyltransferase beta subunit